MLTTKRRALVPRPARILALSAVACLVFATPQAAAAPTFAIGQMQDQTVGAAGCGTNNAGEPSIHVSKNNLVGLGSENGLGSGSEYWRATQTGGSSAATGCDLVYSGQPNAVSGGTGASGGDIDTTFAPVKSSAGTYRIYVASLNLGSVNVAVSNDDGKTFSQTPVQTGLPGDDREWLAAYGADTSLLSFHDITTSNIDVLRSDNGGGSYVQISRVIPDTDYKATNNELGNLVIDHVNASPVTNGFWAYQSFVAPSTPTGQTYDEAFVGVSNDGGHTWTDKPIPCTTAFGAAGLNHNFPNISVAPDGSLTYAVSNDSSIYVARSTDHGDTWSCSGAISTVSKAIFPWVVATSAGADLAYYGSPNGGQNWYLYMAQNPTGGTTGWTNTQITPVHQGQVCEGGISCTGGRQLFDDFGIDTDQNGWAHIAFSHDSPNLGGSGTYTGYAVQTGGNPVGVPN